MLFHEAKQILEQHKKDLLQLGVRTLAIFGSVVRIDVLIDFDATKELFGFARVKRFLEKLLNCEVDLVTKNGLHPALKDQILQEAQYVF